jgi:hypothetical protein
VALHETICLATALGMDPGPLLDVSREDHEQRMVKFLQMVKTLPLILLAQPPPRLRRHGFRWAPATFLNCFRALATNPFCVLHGNGEIGPDGIGLLFTSWGLELSVASSSLFVLGDEFDISVSTGGRIQVFNISYLHRGDQAVREPDGIYQKPALIWLSTMDVQGELTCLAESLDKGM